MSPHATRLPGTGSMLCLQGHGVVKGFVIGRAVVMGASALEVPHYRIGADEVAGEIERLRAALDIRACPKTHRAIWPHSCRCTACCWKTRRSSST